MVAELPFATADVAGAHSGDHSSRLAKTFIDFCQIFPQVRIQISDISTKFHHVLAPQM